MIIFEENLAYRAFQLRSLLFGGNGAVEFCEECSCSIETRQGIDGVAVSIENIVDAVAGDGAFDAAAIAHIDGDARDGTDGLPVENKMVAQVLRDFGVRIERGAKEAAVRATVFLVEFAKKAQGKNGFPGFF